MIIELAIPRSRVRFEPRADSGAWRQVAVEPESREEQASNETVVEDARQFLTGQLEQAPVWLAAAKAFAGVVRPDRLAAIAESPLVRAVDADHVRR